MKRRTFLRNSVALSAFAATAGVSFTTNAAPRRGQKQEYYELRAYRLKSGASAESLHAFLEKAAIPGLSRLGAGPIGVFSEMEQKESATVFVLIPYPNMDAYTRGTEWLKKDDRAQKAAGDYLNTPKEKPGFERIDVWLLQAFAGMPRVELPDYSKEKRARIFELRTYESYSELKAAKKVEMFNDGEIDIMREVGLAPVFYGEALAGPALPHLTYMISAENEEAHKKHWDAFVKHPKWDQMKNDPKYADTVSKITKWFLKPAAYSQI